MGGEEFRQLLTYLKLADKPVGFLINFGAKEFSFGKMHEEDGKHLHGLYRLINQTKDLNSKLESSKDYADLKGNKILGF